MGDIVGASGNVSAVVRDWGEEVDLDEFEKEAVETLAQEKGVVKPFWVGKYEKEAVKNWNIFYKRNKANFFKDRHYLTKEFQDLRNDADDDETLYGNLDDKLLVELGCGVGNAVLPLMHTNKNLRVCATDCAAEAIELLNHRVDEDEPETLKERLVTGVIDATAGEWDTNLPAKGTADFVLILFMLSAVSPEKHEAVAKLASELLKPGGTLLFRDYARYDMAQLRFATNKGQPSKLADNFYVRADSTRSYFFTIDELKTLFGGVGLEEVENRYHRRVVVNRKQAKEMKRVWIQSRFRKPI